MEKNPATSSPITSPAFAAARARSEGPTSPKQQFIDSFKKENPVTRRVMTALPEGQSEFRPHPSSKTAREVASIFSLGNGGIAAALTNNWQWPPQFPPAPATYAEVVSMFDATTQAVQQALVNTPDSRLFETVPFFTGPKQMGDVRVVDILWFMLLDSIHHRGQLSVYVRMTGGKVPSIYGPSGDEPWV
jgi:uncharacterized damage-inducible protein DinB